MGSTNARKRSPSFATPFTCRAKSLQEMYNPRLPPSRTSLRTVLHSLVLPHPGRPAATNQPENPGSPRARRTNSRPISSARFCHASGFCQCSHVHVSRTSGAIPQRLIALCAFLSATQRQGRATSSPFSIRIMEYPRFRQSGQSCPVSVPGVALAQAARFAEYAAICSGVIETVVDG